MVFSIISTCKNALDLIKNKDKIVKLLNEDANASKTMEKLLLGTIRPILKGTTHIKTKSDESSRSVNISISCKDGKTTIDGKTYNCSTCLPGYILKKKKYI